LKNLIVISILLCSQILFSQSLYIDAAVKSSTVTSSEAFTYQITTNGSCTIEPPDLDDFEILDRQQGQFSETSYTNGKTTNNNTYTLTLVLRAKKKGKIKIGKARIKCKGKDKKSEEITMEVVDADEVHKKNEGVATYYYKLECDKKSVIVGEPYIVSFYLYSEKKPYQITEIYSGNAANNWRQNLFDERASDFSFPTTLKTVKGKKYYVVELRKEVYLADHPGKLKIEPYFGRAIDKFDYFNPTYMEGYSNSHEINVKPIPGTKPEDFNGMVGDFALDYEISETSVKANHAFELKIKVSGTGNFNVFQDPKMYFPESFLVSNPDGEESFSVSEDGITGSIEYEYVITATEEGQYVILPFSFSYYSLKERKIKTLSSSDFVIKVSKGKNPKIKNYGEKRTDVKEDDIRYIHTEKANYFRLNDFLFGRISYFIMLLSPIGLSFIFILLRRKKKNRSSSEIQEDKQKNSKKSILKELSSLKAIAQSGDHPAALKKLITALDLYFITNLELSMSSLSKKSIAQALIQKDATTATKDSFNKLWDKIEMAQYAPISTDNLAALIEESEALIKLLNKEI